MFHRLSERIRTIASKINYSVSDNAPATFAELRAHNGSGLVIWSGGSDQTIYGDPATNWAFRAWHDQLHLDLSAEFTLEGEILVAREQARILGDDSGEIILAEVIGQAEHFAKHGQFPVNQIEFITNYLKGRAA